MRWAVLALCCCAAACAAGPTAPSGPPTTLSVTLTSGAWETLGEPQPFPLRNDGAMLVFDFPSSGSINYLFTTSAIAAIRGTLVMSVQVTTNGAVWFESVDAGCNLPTAVRPFLWANDNGNGNFDRWWSNPRGYTLAAGTAAIAVPLGAEHWSSVNGKFGNADGETRFAFEKALLNVTRLGLTFGGGCSFGHGVRVRGGTASFALTEYAIR